MGFNVTIHLRKTGARGEDYVGGLLAEDGSLTDSFAVGGTKYQTLLEEFLGALQQIRSETGISFSPIKIQIGDQRFKTKTYPMFTVGEKQFSFAREPQENQMVLALLQVLIQSTSHHPSLKNRLETLQAEVPQGKGRATPKGDIATATDHIIGIIKDTMPAVPAAPATGKSIEKSTAPATTTVTRTREPEEPMLPPPPPPYRVTGKPYDARSTPLSPYHHAVPTPAQTPVGESSPYPYPSPYPPVPPHQAFSSPPPVFQYGAPHPAGGGTPYPGFVSSPMDYASPSGMAPQTPPYGFSSPTYPSSHTHPYGTADSQPPYQSPATRALNFDPNPSGDYRHLTGSTTIETQTPSSNTGPASGNPAGRGGYTR